MPSPRRVSNWVLVLSPVTTNGMKDAVNLGRQACRTAFQMGMTPIYPYFYCMSFMTEEEVGRNHIPVAQQWSRRVSKIWVCLPPDGTKLDPASHDLLLFNEGHMRDKLRYHDAPSRLPVYRFWVQDNGTTEVQVIDRSTISTLLRCNIMNGLFRGFATAEAVH